MIKICFAIIFIHQNVKGELTSKLLNLVNPTDYLCIFFTKYYSKHNKQKKIKKFIPYAYSRPEFSKNKKIQNGGANHGRKTHACDLSQGACAVILTF